MSKFKIIDVIPGTIVSYAKDHSRLYKVQATIGSTPEKYVIIGVDGKYGRVCTRNDIAALAIMCGHVIIDTDGNEVELDELERRQHLH